MKNIIIEKYNDIKIGGLYGSSASLFITNVLEKYKNILVILNNNTEINNLSKELRCFVKEDININKFYDYDKLPYEEIDNDIELLSERLKTYHNLIKNSFNLTLSCYSALSKNIPPEHEIIKYFSIIDKSTKYNNLINIIKQMDYNRTFEVKEKGEYRIQGSIIDIFSLIENYPYRIVYDNDQIISIKRIDLNTQKSQQSIDSFILSNTKEIQLSKENLTNYKKNCKKLFDTDYVNDLEYEKVINKIYHPNLYNLLPLFYKEKSDIFDLMNKQNFTIITSKPLLSEFNKYRLFFDEYYEKIKYEKNILESSNILVTDKKIKTVINDFNKIEITSLKIHEDRKCYNMNINKLPSVIINNTFKDPFSNLEKFLRNTTYKVLLCIGRKSLQNELLKILKKYNIACKLIDSYYNFRQHREKICLLNKSINEGFIDNELKLAVISEKDIFGYRSITTPHTSTRRNLLDDYINNISSLQLNDAIVHDNYGVGRYKGLINMDIEGRVTELIKIEYANQDTLYIPVTSINLLKRYVGHTGLNTPLHNLGSDYWTKIKIRAKKKINDIAVELLETQSKRMSENGYKYQIDDKYYQKFCSQFPFIYTEDQNKVTNEVLNDMNSKRPMDRLICGDVGFGKTEIIMRSAFISTINNKQVMILVPTTILAEQHYETFKDRFAEFPINIDKLSRLQTSSSKNNILEKLANKQIDIIIGTHSLLNKNIKFDNLGLLIIDEEHKFGVAAKEKIKNLKKSIDVIALSATPIPRTLNTALSQIKDLSIINSPPTGRKSIDTKILEWDEVIISDAIQREIQRGGQIYYVHNDIKSMQSEVDKIKNINKKIKIGIIHGQLKPNLIEKEMKNFLKQKYDVLVCTSIIESGLDIPNVNTIIINDVVKFGLSQLHQIRGRVGRTSKQAYAYFIIKDKLKITKNAIKRLEAIDSIQSLGGGLELATHDLEIRGAGEILGEEQSGQIYEIGYAMYTEMLSKSIEFLKDGKNEEIGNEVEIDTNFSALIPQDYINDVYTRLTYYKRISMCKDKNSLINMKDELIDRFGLMPQYLENLFLITELKIKIFNIKIKLIKMNDNNTIFEFNNSTDINLKKILSIYDNSNLKIYTNNRIKYTKDFKNPEEHCKFVESFINSLE